MSSIGFMILIQVVLIGLNAIFACAEIAVISMNDNKLAKMAQEGDKRAVRLKHLTDNPSRFLATIQVAITLSGFLGSAFAAENFSEILTDWIVSWGVGIPVEVIESFCVIVITLILSYFTLVFGELVPKQLAMRKAESLALKMSGLVSGISKMFAPIVNFLTFSTNIVLKMFGIDPDEVLEEDSEEEIRMLVDVGSENGSIDDDEKEFIKKLFEFDDIPVGEVCIHRKEVIFLRDDEGFEEWKEIVYKNKYSYYPVYSKTPDNIVNVISSDAFFRNECKTKEEVIEKASVKPYFVPETLKSDVCFENMKNDHKPFAIVVDEYGGTCGLVTINDLVSMVVGNIRRI